MVIRQERQVVLDLLRTNVSKGIVMSLLFDETTYCTNKHPVGLLRCLTRQRDSMPHDLQSYPNLLSLELQKLLHILGEWRLYWKQKVVDDVPSLIRCNGGKV